MLDRILANKRLEIASLDEAELKQRAVDAPEPRPFLPPPAALGASGGRPAVRLIAELKRASPSRGVLLPDVDLADLASIYAGNGAAAISVLTDAEFFLGNLDTLRGLRSGALTMPPLLRKDFILAPAQLYETRGAGADAVLLIAAALPDDAELAGLHALALSLGLTPLVEVHTQPELERVLALPELRLIGINNRDLSTFAVNLDVTIALRPHIPEGIQVVSESGIFSAADVDRLAAAGVDAVLVGEALVTAPDIAAKVRELAGTTITAP
jgi:indole-3-glycerol phosphate synthase